jgi:hypothetical protein
MKLVLWNTGMFNSISVRQSIEVRQDDVGSLLFSRMFNRNW